MSGTAYAVGVDIGGTNSRAARIGAAGKILEKVSVPTSRDAHMALDRIVSLVRQMGGDGAAAIGVGIPGRVNGWTGEVISGGFLDMSTVDLKGALETAFSCPVLVANDCSMALVGESRCGAARGLGSAAMMTIGTGIGGAVMENGRIVHGHRCAGQLGHLVVKLGGAPCNCGQRGCVEAESSGTALRRHLAAAGFGPEARFEHILEKATAGDDRARKVLVAWAEPLRAAINTLSAALDPDAVLIGGGMGQAAVRALDFLPGLRSWYDIDIRPADLGDDAGIIGAGLSAMDLVVPALTGKRLVMVNGVPASGKSRLAAGIAERTGWPVLALDTIKNPFLERIEGVDREFNRILGQASYKAIFSTIAEAPEGATFVVDAWFGFQPTEVLQDHLAMAGIDRIAEIWCHAGPDVVRERYLARAGDRLPGHPGAEYAKELFILAGRAHPIGLGPVLKVDTGGAAVALDKVANWAKRSLEG
ncbi:MAG: ROK family protein [Pseudorhodobacter sp.]